MVSRPSRVWTSARLVISYHFWLPNFCKRSDFFFLLLSGRTEMCNWLSDLYYAAFWPRTLQEELFISAHSSIVVFTRVPCHVPRGFWRILLGHTTCVPRLSVSLPQEDGVETIQWPLSVSRRGLWLVREENFSSACCVIGRYLHRYGRKSVRNVPGGK